MAGADAPAGLNRGPRHSSVHCHADGRPVSEAADYQLRYLPPSSPDVTPIEPAFSTRKTHLRGIAARSCEPLLAAIGSGLSQPRSGRPQLIGPPQEPALAAQVAANPDATLAMHCAMWQTDHGLRISISAMRRRLVALSLTLKKRT